MAFLGSVEYKQEANGTAVSVKCPLANDWIDPIDCMENQEVKAEHIPSRFKEKPDWKKICESCPFRNY